MAKKRRMMILTEGQLGIFSSKTATSLIRYCPDETVCVLDSKAARSGKRLEEIINVGHGIPIVSTVAEGLKHKPDQLVIGIAPVGGKLPESWRKIILQAISAGLHIVSGLHHILNDDKEFAAAAKRKKVTIWDCRVAPADISVAEDKLRDLKQRRVALVGSDCNLGKMVTSIELDRGLRKAGYDSEFVATGQTGIMIAGSGIATDHVISDYVNGAAERLCWERRKRQIVIIEGQGSVFHPAYSGVTVGMLHGSMPHAIIYQHGPKRTRIHHYEKFPIPPVPQGIKLVEDLVKPLFPAKVIAVGLNTVGMTDDEAERAMRKLEDETGLPAADPIRHGPEKLVRATEKALGLKRPVLKGFKPRALAGAAR
ncbi:MAG TPA: DUF1611 domain-containing protein [Planctomycetota bacterium]|nr:DUF1611 domain-containing protein [Planctomycetota bacterium]